MIHMGFSRNSFRKSPSIHIIKNVRKSNTYKEPLAMQINIIVDSKINNNDKINSVSTSVLCYKFKY